MCGITGLFSLSPNSDRVILHRTISDMTKALLHRGPDSGDVWQDPDFPLALGHRRLAIIDLSPAGHQPMPSHSGRYTIVFNGEIYNFQSIRRELAQSFNVTFKGSSDTEIILCAIEHWGLERTLERIQGMFAFALWDKKAKALHFARDRFGKKPLYIGWAESTIVFASELKALMAHPDFSRDINRNALTSYMRFRYVPAPLCIFKNVIQLPAGHKLSLDLDLLRGGQDFLQMIEPFWSAKTALEAARRQPITSQEGLVEDFENLLSDCVQDRMLADVPLGAFLSGGIDSSTITALMQKNSAEKIKTYTIGFHEDAYNEASHAKAIAQHLGTDHHELYLSSADSLAVIEKLPFMYDEPFADASALPTYLVSHFARKSVTVALSGDGGDEMLGGYRRHVSGPKGWDMACGMPAPIRRSLAKLILSIPPQQLNKLRPKHPEFGSGMHKLAHILTRESEADVYLGIVSEWQKPKALVVDGREELISLVDPAQQIDGLNFPETMMYWDTISYLCGDVLTKVDRASMAASLEARAPLLDTRIYDFVWRLPLDVKIKNGQGKWLLREVLKRHVPEHLFNRPKQGFGVPIATWLRHDLKDWAEDLLDPRILRDQGYLNYQAVREIWDDHQKGYGNHTGKLWTVLMFQDWHRQWMN